MAVPGLARDIARQRRPDRWARLREIGERHPYLVLFALAIGARALLAVVIALAADGTLFLDDATYIELAKEAADGETEEWPFYSHWLYDRTATFLVPVTLIFRIGGPVLAAQMFIGLLGALTALATFRVAREFLTVQAAFFAGVVIALLPSQIFWSSLVLKDAVVWLLLSALAVLAALSVGGSRRLVILVVTSEATALYLLGHTRPHTMVVAAFTLFAASFFAGSRDWRWRTLCSGFIVLLLPLALGLGLAGSEVWSNLAFSERRLLNAEGAKTAIVGEADDGSVSDEEAGEPEDGGVFDEEAGEPEDGGVFDELRHLPRGVSVMLLEPLPWQTMGSRSLSFARGEAVLWYPVLILASIGLLAAHRHRRVLAFPILVGGFIVGGYGLSEGNLGTAFRHRGEVVWVVAVLAGAGVERVMVARRGAGGGMD